MDGSARVMAKMAGLKATNKKLKTKSKRPDMDTLKEEVAKPFRKLSREERKAKEQQDARKKFYLNVTYKQFLKYLGLLKISEDELRVEISKDHDELVRKYGMYIVDSEPEDEGEDDGCTTTTSTEYFITAVPTQTTLNENSKKSAVAEPEMTKSAARLNASLRAWDNTTLENKKGGGTVSLPAIVDSRKPSTSRSPRVSRVPPPFVKTAPEAGSEPKLDDLGLPLEKNNSDLMEKLLSDSRVMLSKSNTSLSERDSLLTRSSPETTSGRGSRASRRGSRNTFPNVTNLSMTSMTNKRLCPSVVHEPDWEKRKLSFALQRWSTSEWVIERDAKYPKEVERLKAFEQAKKKGERIRNRDIPITCQRWKYVPLDDDSPLKFGVTYTGTLKPKKKPTPYRRKNPIHRRKTTKK